MNREAESSALEMVSGSQDGANHILYDYGLRLSNYCYKNWSSRLATRPGVENTVAVDDGEYVGISVFDFNPASQTAIRRGASTWPQGGTYLAFPNASSMFVTDLESSPNSITAFITKPLCLRLYFHCIHTFEGTNASTGVASFAGGRMVSPFSAPEEISTSFAAQ